MDKMALNIILGFNSLRRLQHKKLPNPEIDKHNIWPGWP